MRGKRNAALIPTKSIPFRRNFYATQKQINESPDEWFTRIKELSKRCCFDKNSDLILLDKFITGLETEIIEYLCLSTEYLSINSSLEIIHAYEAQKFDPDIDSSPRSEENPHSSNKVDAVFSEILIKSEPSECIGYSYTIEEVDVEDSIDENSFEATVATAQTDTNSSNNNSKCDKTESILSKTDENEQLVRVEILNETDGDLKNEKHNDEPKKKRKYKKRAKKEKRTYECEVCHYKCEHQCHLSRHKLIHLNQKSFICDKCGKSFNLFINLNAHIRRHIGFKPHSCHICQASFIDKTRLKLHIRTHTGEKPFGCTVCEKRFADRYYLKVHMRLHTGEKPFQCDVCKKSFSQSCSLSTHKKSCSRKAFKNMEKSE